MNYPVLREPHKIRMWDCLRERVAEQFWIFYIERSAEKSIEYVLEYEIAISLCWSFIYRPEMKASIGELMRNIRYVSVSICLRTALNNMRKS